MTNFENRDNTNDDDETKIKSKKTGIFEEKYGVDIRDFSSTEEIDKVVEDKIGRKLKIVDLRSLTSKDNIDIDEVLEETMKDVDENVDEYEIKKEKEEVKKKKRGK